MLAAAFAVAFALSLLPGRKPLCLRFAERVSDGILPDGARDYCRRLTWFWFALLSALTLANLACIAWVRPLAGPRFGWMACAVPSILALAVVPAVFLAEKRVRDRRFTATFHTSGSTGKSKTIVKTFESLAREVAMHRSFYRSAGIKDVRFIATVDPRHMYGMLWRVMLPKAMGCSCDPEVVLSPESLLAKMREGGRVFLVTTPSFLDRFTAYADQYDVPQNCVEIVSSGALLSKDVSDRTKRVFGIEPRQIFGSTEAGGVAWRRGDGEWRVLDPVSVRLDGGRLAVKSPFSFRRGWYAMGDGAELTGDGRTFRLLGRMDRLVKIKEERVNLAEMEEKVRALGFKEAALVALDGDRGPFLGCVVAGSEPVPALEMRRRLLPLFPRGTVPRRFRFVRSLPRNAQGKVPASEIARLLESALAEPRMRNVSVTESSFSAELVFDAAAPYFQGHFPQAPILPGVAQLGFAERFAESVAGRPMTLRGVRKMKFMRVIAPGEPVCVSVVRRNESEFAYEYRNEEGPCSSGVLQF